MVLIGVDRCCVRWCVMRKVRIRVKVVSRVVFRRIFCCCWLKVLLDMLIIIWLR